jgi:folylpolyglutamate synthase/dihydropteroate synthase
LKPLTSLPSRHFPDLPSAIKVALNANHPVLVTGSLFLAGEALENLKKAGFETGCL